MHVPPGKQGWTRRAATALRLTKSEITTDQAHMQKPILIASALARFGDELVSALLGSDDRIGLPTGARADECLATVAIVISSVRRDASCLSLERQYRRQLGRPRQRTATSGKPGQAV